VRRISINKFLVILVASICLIINSCNSMNVDWTELDPLPPPVPGEVQPGLAGPFAGLHGNTLIVAGGANFPDTMPWHGGKKNYHDEIYLLNLSSGASAWQTVQGEDGLPRPVAYGASASVSAGVVCMGGETESGLTDEAYIISVAGGRPLITPLPPLPVPLSGAAAASEGSVVFIAGGASPSGSSKSLWRLDAENIGAGWQKLADMPLPLINSVMAVTGGKEKTLWLLGGRTRGDGDDTSVIHPEIFRYSIAEDLWSHEGVLSDGSETLNLAAGTGAAVSGKHIALFGGNDGSVFNRVEAVLSEMAREDDPGRREELKKEYIALQESHPGFSRSVILFDTETGKSFRAGEIPGPVQVTTTAVVTPFGIVIPSGEIKPGVRTPEVRMVKFR
jgi:N-acetylneuraminic acid mutarotase